MAQISHYSKSLFYYCFSEKFNIQWKKHKNRIIIPYIGMKLKALNLNKD